MYHTVHYDKQKKKIFLKNIETDYAKHNVKRLRSLLYNSRLNEERQRKSSSQAGKVSLPAMNDTITTRKEVAHVYP